MKNSDFKYACRINLPIKRDGSMWFCDDYTSLNMQTRKYSFPMPLIDHVLSQMGNNQWLSALDLQPSFWQI
jgi:hypothetical protein